MFSPLHSGQDGVSAVQVAFCIGPPGLTSGPGARGTTVSTVTATVVEIETAA